MPLTDEELVGRCLAGEEEAFRLLVERYDRRVYQAIYRLVRSEPDARDLTQETFLRFFRSLDRLDPQRGLATWILRIATNQTIDFLRKQRHSIPIEEAEIGDASAAFLQEFDPDAERVREQKRALVDRAIRRLAPSYQVVLELRHTQGMPTEQIAEILDLAPSTVRSRLFRAHRQISAWLQGREPLD